MFWGLVVVTLQALLSDLFELLRYELDKYYELLKILYAERDLLVKREIKELEALIKDEESTIQKIQKIEITRDALLTRLATEEGLVDQSLNATTITSLADEPLKSDYQRLFQRNAGSNNLERAGLVPRADTRSRAKPLGPGRGWFRDLGSRRF